MRHRNNGYFLTIDFVTIDKFWVSGETLIAAVDSVNPVPERLLYAVGAMSPTNSALSFAALAGILATELILSSGVMAAAPAQSIATPQKSAAYEVSLDFNPPNRGAPGTTAGGASRGSGSACARGSTPLTLLVPADKTGKFGLTASVRPTLLVYVPKTAARSAEFTLIGASSRNQRESEEIVRTTVRLSGEAGIVALKLPESAPALMVGKDYQWYVSLICNPEDRTDDIVVSAWVSRTQPNATLVRNLERAKPHDRPALYSASSYWYDTVATLVELRQSNPKDSKLQSDWTQLLQSVGLKDMADKPLLLQPAKPGTSVTSTVH